MRKKSYTNIICLLIILFWLILFFENNMTEFYVTVSVFAISLILIALLPNKKNYLFTFLPLVLPTALLFYSKFGFAHIMPVIMLLCDFKYLKRDCTAQKDDNKKSDVKSSERSSEHYVLIITNLILSAITLYILIPRIISQKNILTNIPSRLEWIYYIFILFVLLLLIASSSKRYVAKNSSKLDDRFNLSYCTDYHVMYIAALIFFVLSVAAFTANTTDILKTVYPWLMYIFILIFYKDPFIDFTIEKCIQKIHAVLE